MPAPTVAAAPDLAPPEIDCEARRREAQQLQVVANLSPSQVDAIKALMAKVSRHLVVRIAPADADLYRARRRGPGVLEVQTLKSWMCSSYRNEVFYVYPHGRTWRVAPSREEVISCD